jgi:hypothetical protein
MSKKILLKPVSEGPKSIDTEPQANPISKRDMINEE